MEDSFPFTYHESHRGASRTAATSKMERFMIIVHGQKTLTTIRKHCILDVAAVLDPPLNIDQTSFFQKIISRKPPIITKIRLFLKAHLAENQCVTSIQIANASIYSLPYCNYYVQYFLISFSLILDVLFSSQKL